MGIVGESGGVRRIHDAAQAFSPFRQVFGRKHGVLLIVVVIRIIP